MFLSIWYLVPLLIALLWVLASTLVRFIRAHALF